MLGVNVAANVTFHVLSPVIKMILTARVDRGTRSAIFLNWLSRLDYLVEIVEKFFGWHSRKGS